MSPSALEHGLGGLGKDFGAGVSYFVDAVAETHEAFFLVQFAADDRLGVFWLGYLEDHV